jgi:tRNA A-37 threonylcarbamoyl transferase component Bud32
MIAAGGILAGYRLDGVVGRGATATVFAATDLARARRVALKVLAPHLSDRAAVRARFREAARVQQSLDHPNILRVHDVVESGGELLLVTPLVEGTLDELISDRALAKGRALLILGQVADAIDHAHRAGVVHGDVKPRNVLVGEDDVAYLADFGLATAVSGAAAGAAASPGTIDYTAPERLRGEPASPSADVYALACVLFECVTGSVPYAYETAAGVVGGHFFDAPARPSGLVKGVPAELDELLARGLAKDPADRPASARELVDGAAAVLAPVGAVLPAPPPASGRPAEPRPTAETLDDPVPLLPAVPTFDTEPARASPRTWIAAAAAVLAAAVLGGWLGARGAGEAEAQPVVAMPVRHLTQSYNAAMRVLRVARQSGLETFAKASTPRAQARAATGVAVSYRTTSASIRRTQPPRSARRATQQLVRAIDRAGVGYTRLAGAARRRDADAYADARRMILDAERDIAHARADLGQAGVAGGT